MIRMKIIPIYTENKKNRQSHTIFLDQELNRSYKAFHKESNQWVYWIGLFAVLAIMRGIQSFKIPLTLLPNILIFSAALGLTYYISRLVYKYMFYEEVKEVYLTDSMIEDYIDDGKTVYKLEIWLAIISFIIFVLLTILYFILMTLILFVFSVFLFFIFCLSLKRLSIARIKLYSRRK